MDQTFLRTTACLKFNTISARYAGREKDGDDSEFLRSEKAVRALKNQPNN